MKYLALFRGINVGGKHRVRMAELRECFEELGFHNVSTYVQSGNVIFESESAPDEVSKQIETALPEKLGLDSEQVKVLVVTQDQLEDVVRRAPEGFGREPDKFYCDAIFLSGITSEEAFEEFQPNPEVDAVWRGPGVVYHRRLSANLAQSHLYKVTNEPVYENMTLRSWNTTIRLLSLME